MRGSLRGAIGPLIGMLVFVAFMGWRDPAQIANLFGDNVRTTLVQFAGLAIAVVGMTLVIRSGGIDLSIGSATALASVTTALALEATKSPALALCCGVASGLVIGGVNGALVSRLRIAPFIATLGTMGIARGLAKWIADNQTVRVSGDALGWLDRLTQARPTPSWFVLAPSVWIALGVAILGAIILHGTVFGIHLTALGSSEATARLCGVRVERVKSIIYVLAGLCAGVAGALLFARLGVGDPTAAIGFELQVVAAAVIGGASLAGGEGSIVGAVCGALLLAFLGAGCNLLGISNAAQEMLTGGIIVAAVAIDAARARWRG